MKTYLDKNCLTSLNDENVSFPDAFLRGIQINANPKKLSSDYKGVNRVLCSELS